MIYSFWASPYAHGGAGPYIVSSGATTFITWLARGNFFLGAMAPIDY